MLTVRYTEWDGTQRVRLSPEQVFEKLAEYLSYTDDVHQAFDWLLRHGFESDDLRVLGLDDLLEAVREQMRARYRDFNLDHALDEVRQHLEDLLQRQREAPGEPAGRNSTAPEKLEQALHRSRRVSETLETLQGADLQDEAGRAELERLLEQIQDIRELEEFQRRYAEMFRGPESLGYEDALALMREMQRLKQLEDDLLGGDLERVGTEDLRTFLGQQLSQDFQHLRDAVALLQESGYLRQREGRMSLSPRGVRYIGQLALREIYQSLLRDRAGSHSSDQRGPHEIRPDATKPYSYGDPMILDVVGTLKKPLARKPGTPLELEPSDFEVFDTTSSTTCSTVLLLDMSWSMSWEGRFAAAKKVALAMESLIRARYPRDYFGIVGFYTRATELGVRDLPEASWNMGDPFTNLQDGLRLGAQLLRRHPSANQHMIIITDGQPTAYFSRGRLYCEWPLSFGGISMRAAQETLREVERVTRQGIIINTFMLDDSPSLRAFVERMTRINRGRALFTRPDRLGKYLLVDYIARRRKRV